jgi:ATP-dependent Clp protease ATP-binding subunit ClpC
MARKKIDEGHDNIRCLAYASIMSIAVKKQHIDADEIFLWTFLYTKEKQFFEVFWKFLWFHDTSDLQEFIDMTYNLQRNQLKWTVTATLQIQADLHPALEWLWQDKNIKKSFVALLYISLGHLSLPFVKYLETHNVDMNTIKNKLHMLVNNEVISDMGVVAFFALITKLMKKLHLSLNDISMMQFETKESIDSLLWAMDHDFFDGAEEVNNDQQSSIKTTSPSKKDEQKKLTIEFFGTDLTAEAKENMLDPVIWREKEINQIIYTLLRKTKNNPLLIGEAWVGKTAVVEWLAQKINSWDVPTKLKNKRIMMLDMWSLLAGTKYRGEFEARLKAILDEASDLSHNIILFIDEIHTIIGSWNQEGSADAANMLKPLLARWKVKLIWATTFDEYQKHIEKDPALKRRFQEVHINEPSTEDTILILRWIKKNYEEYHSVHIEDDALIHAVSLSKRYILNKQLPDKAIDIIDEACARRSTMVEKMEMNDEYVQLENSLTTLAKKIEEAIEKQDYFAAANHKQQEEAIKTQMKHMRLENTLPDHLRPTITKEDIWIVLAEKIWVPSDQVTASEVEKLRRLEWGLKGQVLWQDDAVNAVVHAMKRNRLSVIQKNKPIASFIFMGPSWVGKTYLAKLLAKEYFGSEKSLIRVDMSEFMEKHSVSKLVWSPAGYVGYDEGWNLTEQVRRKPYSVILFDEIEKASPDVLNIMLQILDEWHLKDNKWRMIDFKSTVIIMTSNIWSEVFSKKSGSIGFHMAGTDQEVAKKEFDSQKSKVLERLKDWMKPELLNRIDYTIVFRPLEKEHIQAILQMQLDAFLANRKAWYEGKLPKFTKKKIQEIVDEIYDPQFGARPIEKYIYEKIEPEIIDAIMGK